MLKSEHNTCFFYTFLSFMCNFIDFEQFLCKMLRTKKKDSERNYTKTCRKYDIDVCDIIGKKRWEKAQDIRDPRYIKINKYIIKLARNTSVNSITEDFAKNKNNKSFI